MLIQFKKYDGKGDLEDPKTGTPISPDRVFNLIAGKVVWGTGGMAAGTEQISILFTDRSSLFFVTTGGIPRIIFVDTPKS